MAQWSACSPSTPKKPVWMLLKYPGFILFKSFAKYGNKLPILKLLSYYPSLEIKRHLWERILTYFLKGSFIVQLTSCFTWLDSAALLMLNPQLIFLLGWIQTLPISCYVFQIGPINYNYYPLKLILSLRIDWVKITRIKLSKENRNEAQSMLVLDRTWIGQK